MRLQSEISYCPLCVFFHKEKSRQHSPIFNCHIQHGLAPTKNRSLEHSQECSVAKHSDETRTWLKRISSRQSFPPPSQKKQDLVQSQSCVNRVQTSVCPRGGNILRMI